MKPKTAREIQIRNEALVEGRNEALDFATEVIVAVKDTIASYKGSQVTSIAELREMLVVIRNKFEEGKIE